MQIISKGIKSYNDFSLVLFLTVGLFVGKEGPMIHSGAVIGAGVPQVGCDKLNYIQ